MEVYDDITKEVTGLTIRITIKIRKKERSQNLNHVEKCALTENILVT